MMLQARKEFFYRRGTFGCEKRGKIGNVWLDGRNVVGVVESEYLNIMRGYIIEIWGLHIRQGEDLQNRGQYGLNNGMKRWSYYEKKTLLVQIRTKMTCVIC